MRRDNLDDYEKRMDRAARERRLDEIKGRRKFGTMTPDDFDWLLGEVERTKSKESP